jgi:uncharacterized protein (TIRG00374 family)
MSRSDLNEWGRSGRPQEDIDESLSASAAGEQVPVVYEDDADEPRFFEDPKRIAQTALVAAVVIAGIYLLIPRLAGVDKGIERIDDGDGIWIAVALAFGVLMFFAYVALFRGVVGRSLRLRWRESYQITMAGLAASRLFSAGGAGGIVLTYWALRKAGMPRKESASRMVAFNVLLYAVYMLTLLINGILLRTGVFNGPAPAGLTIVPAAIAGGVIALFLFIALIPGNLERRFSEASQKRFWGRFASRLATVPSTLAVGTREAFTFIREPSRGGLALIGAIGFWATQIAILWASFKAFDAHVPLAVIVQGFFVGMAANMLPTPGGVGAVDAGLIGTFAVFGVSGLGATVIPAVLVYRLVAFWLPLLPGIVAFVQLRRTVNRWSAERPSRLVAGGAVPERGTSESKV